MENGKESQPPAALAKPFTLRMTTQVKKEVVKTNVLAGKGFIEVEEEEIHSQKRSVAYLEDGVVKDNDDFPVRKKEKKEYLIPMKKIGNDWRIERLKKIIEEGSGTEEDKARLALMLDAIGGEGGDEEVDKTTTTGGAINFNGAAEETAEEAADADYEKIPIGEFGLAFLRGCGWREQDGIGSTNRKAVKLRVSEPRPKGLGLGANISQSGKQSKDQANGKRKELEKNTRVKIVSGADRGTCGQVKSMDEDNSSCFVELDSNRRIVRVSQYALEVLDKKM